MKIMVVSQTKERADAFSVFVKRLISDLPVLQHLIPGPDQRNSNISFDVRSALPDQSPSVKSVGITGQLTGSRADLIVADDVETPGNSLTQSQRDKLSELVKEFDAILKPGGQVIFLGTPQTEQTLYLKLTQRGYNLRIWPARMPDHTYSDNLSPFISQQIGVTKVGTPLDPMRFDDMDLVERQTSYGRTGFALQFMLDTRVSDALRYPLKLADLIVVSGASSWSVAPPLVQWASNKPLVIEDLTTVGLDGDHYHEPMYMSPQDQWGAWDGAVMTIDPSGRGADETGWSVTKVHKGIIYLLACGGFRDGYSDATLEALTLIAKRWSVNEIVYESNYGDGMFGKVLEPILKRGYPVTLTEVRHTGQKERRIIDTLEPVMNQHKLVVTREVIEDDYNVRDDNVSAEKQLQYMLFHQMTRITQDRGSLGHDDRLEAVAMAVNYWIEHMDMDVQESEEIARQEAIDREIDDFLDDEPGLIFEPGGSRDDWHGNLRIIN